MKSKTVRILSALVAFSMICAAGCTTTYLSLKEWEGRTVHDLYFEWGQPDEIEPWTRGGTIYTYISTRTDDDGEVKTCRKSFYARDYGHGEIIKDTSYSDCLFLMLK